LSLSAQQFFQSIVVEALAARAMVEGANFFFGHNRSGTIDVLRGLAAAAGILLEVVEPLVVDGEVVSSSRVRRLVGEGRMDEARALLTQPYRIRGRVTTGEGRGAKIGFPTANLDGIDTLLPAQGVYAGSTCLAGRTFPAAIHIGANPTFGQQQLKVEVHVIGWQSSLVGQTVEVEFLSRLRGTERFAGVDQLVAQLRRDVARAAEMFQATAAR
jgi:riboflavin kinase/FMN adenylyltransferase